ncbi:hypothetical protein N836_27635 [Leptolyngbya sp. Heron Island J]|uniref:hypothetical protein n=1 Tax=Leptolyngbya sp. Heron Island J TaxID=1385935 RepID=UPI0003B9E5EA|nr:hypothetical protein [Leptolyngbya sp. Heron Island J]ESA32366.1 hypothetical protein N836_27635 [Leptolyngbya sp. Heron Island J]
MGFLRWVCLLGLVLLLQACSSFGTVPPQSVIERGLAIKIAQTQQALTAHLAPKVPQLPNFKLRQVEVTLREAQDDDTFHVQGTYQAIMQLASQEKKESGPFDIYLAREKTEDTVSWFLLSDHKRELLVTNPT